MFWWPNMATTIANYIKAYQSYTQNKSTTYTLYGNLLSFTPSSHLWQYIGIDMITDLSRTRKTNYNSILVAINYFIKICHFILCKKTLNTKYTTNLLMEMVIKHHGVPAIIVSDRDKHWINKFWSNLCNCLNIKQVVTIFYQA